MPSKLFTWKTHSELITCFLILLTGACKPTHIARASSTKGELIFQSGFEQQSTVISSGKDGADIIGADESLPDHNDWVRDLDGHPYIGNFSLQFHPGDSTMRAARIVAD